jgi:hypothetical protein
MNAAKKALENSKNLFPQLDHQKRVIANSLKRQKVQHKPRESDSNDEKPRDKSHRTSDSESRLPKQYQKRMNIVSDASDISSSSLDEHSSDDSDSDSYNSNSKFKIREECNEEEEEDGDSSMKSVEIAPPKEPPPPTHNVMEPISSPEPEPPKEDQDHLEDISSDLSEGEIDDD